MPTILCYGDSNTWGYEPVTGSRLSAQQRWPGALRRGLPASCEVVEEGLCGRTVQQDDPYEPGRSGLAYLAPCLASHAPIDLVVLMLGTNDLKGLFRLDVAQIARGAARLVREVRQSLAGPGGAPPEVLLVAPPPLAAPPRLAEIWGFTAESVATSRQLAAYYRRAAEDLGCPFFDAGEIAAASALDGVHLDLPAHEKLGTALAGRVRLVLRLVASPT